MSNTATFLVAGVPVPYVRQSQRDKWEHRSAVTRYRTWADLVRWTAKRNLTWREPLTGPIWLGVLFSLQVPESWTRKRKAQALAETPEAWPVGRGVGDVDNLFKGVADALNGIAYLDDAQIIGLAPTWKRYGDPGALITVSDNIEGYLSNRV